jgi:hypothetical protein
MLARVITLRFDTVLGSFDDVPLRDFRKDKEVFAVREHFLSSNISHASTGSLLASLSRRRRKAMWKCSGSATSCTFPTPLWQSLSLSPEERWTPRTCVKFA